MTDSLRGIEAFVRTAESRSFTAAARQLGMRPSGVSNAVARLERELGVSLLNRTTRSVSLTDEGAAFLESASQAVAFLRKAREDLAVVRGAPHGRLRVSLPRALGRLVVLPHVRTFQSQHPAVALQVDLDDRVVGVIEEGYDVVVRVVAEPKDSRLVARRLAVPRLITCAAPCYLDRHGAPARPEDLRRHDCLRFAYPDTGRIRAWRFRAPGGGLLDLDVAGTLGSNSNEALVAAALAGAGVVQIHAYHVSDMLRLGELREILADWSAPGTPVLAMYAQGRHVSPKVRTFVDYLVRTVPAALAPRQAA